MIAAIVNALGILIGGTLGTLLRSKINHKLVDCLMTAMVLVVEIGRASCRERV